MTPLPQCCKAVNWRVAGARSEVARLAMRVVDLDTPRRRAKLAAAKAAPADNKRWADEHAATHAGGDDAA